MPPLTEEQKVAINSIDSHVLVSAGAGSGKTFVLVERYINVLKSRGDASINDIIAVTYTRKAAEEMRSRLKLRLKQLAEESTGEQRQRWLKCLAELEYARIGTIHSLCESILKNYPSESGIDPGFEILDDLERAELLSESIDVALHMIIEKPAEDFEELLDYPVEGLRRWLGEFLRSPLKYKDSRQKFADGSLESTRAFAEDFIKNDIEQALKDLMANKSFLSELSYLRDTAWPDRESKLGLLQEEMLTLLDVITNVQGKTCQQRWEALLALASMESAKNAGGPAAKELRSCMRIIRTAAMSMTHKHKSCLNHSDERAFRLIRALINLADDALHRYELLKERHQKLDFDDLIERSQQLMSKSGHAVRQITKRLLTVLVDEFQDTNWTQAKLLAPLASGTAKLFLIGDDKQSIYKFQGADVSTFNACKTYISSLQNEDHHKTSASHFELPCLEGSGQLLTLSQSFRSHPEIVNFVNYFFRALFGTSSETEDFKSQFQALLPARERNTDESDTRVELIYTPPFEADPFNVRQEQERLEGELTAQWINDKLRSGVEIFDKALDCHRPINYGDFAILLQANSDFAGVESALSQASIPFVSIAGSGFLDRQEIFDLENMLKWLSCPQDSHALFAILRSPLFGFSDDILHELKAGNSMSLWQCLSVKSQEEGQADLSSARRTLQNLQHSAGLLNLPELIREIIFKTCYDVVLLCAAAGKQKSRNVWKFASLAAQHKHMSVSEFLKSLKSMRELGVKNLTDAPLSSENAVKIMTIHKSKGLEFAAVALPRLARSAHQANEKLLFGKDLGIALDCTRDTEEEKPAFFTAAVNLNRKMDEEEKKRLFYVATTRARDYLALFITPRCKRGTNFGKWLIDALALPEPEGEIETLLVEKGAAENRCSWKIWQPSRIVSQEAHTDREAIKETTKVYEAIESNSKDQEALGAPASSRLQPIGPAENEFSEHKTFNSLLDLSLLEQTEASALPPTYTPVPWQSLLRVCPADETPSVHATISGNYFHLLMSKLGPNLELPSEDDRRALLQHHEVAIHNHAQQELLLKESEHLLITFKNSPLFSMLKSAKRRLTEHSYIIIREGKEQEFRPDLIVEDSSATWHIIDFKTDQFEMKLLSKQLAQHQAQLTTYVDDLEQLLSIRAKAWIYFAHYGRLEPVNTAAPVQLSLFNC